MSRSQTWRRILTPPIFGSSWPPVIPSLHADAGWRKNNFREVPRPATAAVFRYNPSTCFTVEDDVGQYRSQAQTRSFSQRSRHFGQRKCVARDGNRTSDVASGTRALASRVFAQPWRSASAPPAASASRSLRNPWNCGRDTSSAPASTLTASPSLMPATLLSSSRFIWSARCRFSIAHPSCSLRFRTRRSSIIRSATTCRRINTASRSAREAAPRRSQTGQARDPLRPAGAR